MRRLRSERVVWGDGEREPLRVAPGWVTLEGALLGAVGEGAPPEDGVPLEDLGDALLAPAFVNPHTHVALHALRGLVGEAAAGNVVEDLFYRVERALAPEDVRAFARMGAWESLLAGVGLVWDHYFFGRALAEGIADTGLAAVVAPTVQDVGGPRPEESDAQLEATLELAADPRPTLAAALGPHATDTVSEALWGRVAGLAEAHALPVHAHLAQSPEEVARAKERHGATPFGWLERMGVLERVQGVFAHALYVDRAELARLDARHALVCCPYSQLIFGFPARLDVWSAAGARWTLATDCAASNDSMSLRKELRFAAGQRTLGTSWSGAYERFLDGEGDADSVWAARSMGWAAFAEEATAPRLLRRVWGLAGALHPALRAGVLAPGALANLTAWDVDHPSFRPAKDPLAALAFADVDGALAGLWVGGVEIGERGDVAGSVRRSPLYEAHREEASARLDALLAAL